MNILFTFDEKISIDRGTYIINWLNMRHNVCVIYTGDELLSEHIYSRCDVKINHTCCNIDRISYD